MRRFMLAGFVSACMLAAQPNPGTGSIQGHVLNSLTTAPVAKATVTLIAPQIILVAETNAEGWFQFTALPPGTFKLSAKRTGFLDHAARHPIVLGPNGDVSDAEIRLPPQGVISGRVLDEGDDPVAEAYVSIMKQTYRDGARKWVASSNARTDDKGAYRIPNLKPGRYVVRAFVQRAPVNNKYLAGGPRETPLMDYVPAFYPNAPGEQTASPVEVGTGSEVRDIDIHLFKVPRSTLFRLSGKVIGLPGDSQPTVSVLAEQPDPSPYTWYASARPPDYAFEAELRPGQYRVFAFVESGGPEAFATGSATVTGDVTGMILAMAQPPELTGRISVAEADSPMSLAGVHVFLMRHPVYRDRLPQDNSDAAGKLSFAKIPPGHYTVGVDHLPAGCFLREVRIGGQAVSMDDVEVLASAQLEIVLSRTAATIAGMVSDDDGKPFPNTSVTLIPADTKSRPIKQVADDNGAFKFTNLPPGKYQLLSWEEVDDDQWQDPEFRKKYESQGTEITVGSSETQNRRLRAIAVEEMK